MRALEGNKAKGMEYSDVGFALDGKLKEMDTLG